MKLVFDIRHRDRIFDDCFIYRECYTSSCYRFHFRSQMHFCHTQIVGLPEYWSDKYTDISNVAEQETKRNFSCDLIS